MLIIVKSVVCWRGIGMGVVGLLIWVWPGETSTMINEVSNLINIIFEY